MPLMITSSSQMEQVVLLFGLFHPTQLRGVRAAAGTFLRKFFLGTFLKVVLVHIAEAPSGQLLKMVAGFELYTI